MLQVFFGSDTTAVRQAAFTEAAHLAGDDIYTSVVGDEYETGQLADLVGGNSLFGEQRVYVIDTPVDKMAEELPALLPALAESSDQFVIIEGPLLAADKKRYAKHTDAVHEYKGEKMEHFNTFALAEALVRKDKRTLWLLLQRATTAGVSAEEVIGILWWQLKSIRLAAITNNAAAAGMKDFPYRKAKQALNTLPREEAERLSHSLLTIYHQGHAGETELGAALEQWVLQL